MKNIIIKAIDTVRIHGNGFEHNPYPFGSVNHRAFMIAASLKMKHRDLSDDRITKEVVSIIKGDKK